jgi:hypothetical protein
MLEEQKSEEIYSSDSTDDDIDIVGGINEKD